MSINKHHNHKYDGGSPNIPLAVGDRYYGQDLGRDFNYLQDRIGLILKDIIQQNKYIAQGGIISIGSTPATQISITNFIGYTKYNITIPDAPWGYPPPTTADDIDFLRIVMSALTDINVVSYGATLDGSSTNYIKIKYNEINLNNRDRAKASGNYYYELEPSYTLTIDTTSPTNYEICLGELVGDGISSLVLSSIYRSPDLTLQKNYIKALISTDSPYTIDETLGFTHFHITPNTSNFTINLPYAKNYKNNVLTIVKIGNSKGQIVLTPQSGETIDGESTFKVIRQYDAISIISNGIEWTIKYYFSIERKQEYITPGAYTFVVPQFCKILNIKKLCGAGGGGGGGAGARYTSFAKGGGGGGGGGAGEMVENYKVDVTPGDEISITIGAKGTGGTGGAVNTDGNDGTDGADTIFGAYITALGGKKGIHGGYLSGTGGNGGQGERGNVGGAAGLDGTDNIFKKTGFSDGGGGGGGGGGTQTPTNGVGGGDGGDDIYNEEYYSKNISSTFLGGAGGIGGSGGTGGDGKGNGGAGGGGGASYFGSGGNGGNGGGINLPHEGQNGDDAIDIGAGGGGGGGGANNWGDAGYHGGDGGDGGDGYCVIEW